jgi:hypothetical protein
MKAVLIRYVTVERVLAMLVEIDELGLFFGLERRQALFVQKRLAARHR